MKIEIIFYNPHLKECDYVISDTLQGAINTLSEYCKIKHKTNPNIKRFELRDFKIVITD